MSLIDTHCHLKFFEENKTLEHTLDRARNAGVTRLITVGTNQDDWLCYQSLAKLYHEIFFTIGLHPCYVDKNWPIYVDSIPDYWNHADKPVAFGEIGLDYFHLPKEKSMHYKIVKEQQRCFCKQLKLAKTLDCPIIVHSRESFADCVKFIDHCGVDWQKVVFHCFSEGVAEINEIIKRGGRASFTGNITYKKNFSLLEVVKSQGVEKLMLETDSPYLSPEPNRKSINEPFRAREIIQFISLLLGYENEELEKVVTRNSKEFFNLDRI